MMMKNKDTGIPGSKKKDTGLAPGSDPARPERTCVLSPAEKNADSAPGLYLHIPFCQKKCIYCDFNSFPGYRREEMHRYMETLVEEMVLAFRSGYLRTAPDTVFLGGGTPSLLDDTEISMLMSAVADVCGRNHRFREVTIEANPGTVDERKLAAYREAGIDRISIGVQSFQNEELQFLGRIHDAETAVRTVKMARSAGFDNLNLDLMFGIPGQTADSWKRTLDTALSLMPDHLSFYSLQIEEGTPLYEMFRREECEAADEALDRQMYHYARACLKQAGFRHYEISNAARPGKECLHNLKYWSMIPYAGLGAGAHSFNGSVRSWNPSSIPEYTRSVSMRCQNHDFLRGVEQENESKEDLISDYLFTVLRTAEGISKQEFRDSFGLTMEAYGGEKLVQFLAEGFLEESEGQIRLTEKGLDFTNYILRELIS